MIKKSVENWPKNSVFRQKRRFRRKNSKPLAVMGGVPPFAVIFFPLIFWPAACSDEGRGGWVPPSRQKAVIGVFEHFPKVELAPLATLGFFVQV